MRLAIDLRPLLESFESGVTHYATAMVRELLKRKELSLELFYQARKPCLKIHRAFPQVRHHPYSNTFFHLRSLWGFPSLPKNYFLEKPDLIWIPDRRPFYKSKIPLVMTIHDRVPEEYSSTLSWKSWLWHRIFSFKRLLTLCSGLLSPSSTISKSLKVNIAKEFTYEGADLAFPKVPKGVQKLKSAPFFLMISPSDPRKRLDWFFKLALRFPQAHFVLLGLKKAESRFSRQALKNYPNLFLFYEVHEAEKAWFLHHACALLALSVYEGFDLPVLEAVRAECPVIMSDIPVHKELYQGQGCFIKTEKELGFAIERALKGQAEIPVPRGDYSWKKAAQRASLFFFRILSDKDGKRGGHRNGKDHPYNA